MNTRNGTGDPYFRLAAFIGQGSMAALIVFHLYYFMQTGSVFHLIPEALCLLSFVVCMPLMRHLKKISDENSQAGYFQAANVFAIFSMVSFLLIRLPEYMNSARYFDVFVLLIYSILVIGSMLFLIIRAKSPASLAFTVPTVAFVFFTAGTIIQGGVSYYFLVYLMICGFGALYVYYKRYRNFVLLSHAVIFCLILADIPFLKPDVPRRTIILQWMLAAYVTAFFLMLSRFSTEKSSRSERAQHTFGTMMATTPNLLAMVDEMNRITYVSKALAELGHISSPEMAAGRPIIDLFYDTDMKLMIADVLDSEGFYEGTMEISRNGKKQYFKITSNVFSGETPGRFIDMSDITPIRTALLDAEEAKVRAEKANSAKSAFLARMSHEIRTPMNAITGLSELILREKASPAIYEYATAVKQAGGNLVALINDILDFSKIESGKMEIVPTDYSFSSLVNDVITIICMWLREKPIYFVVNIDHAIPCKLYGDVVRMRQVLLNILSNAVKYTNQGHIIFTIEVESWEESSLNLKFEVVDTGIGIKQEDIGEIFGNFSRLDSRHNYEVEGTGLGLAITRSLCLAMRGDITVDSVYEAGSTFTAYIPQKILDKTPFAEVIDPENKKVLVFETREIYGNSIVCSLDNLGVFCKLVTGIDEFTQILETDSFDFILAASFVFDKAREEIQKRGINTILVLLAEYGEVIADRQTRFIAMPVHPLSIAHVLNGEEELRFYTETPGVSFTAPDARILIVDDIKTNLTVAAGLLIPYAIQVDSCLTGKEAIGLVQKNKYDLVLMDHMMPDMNGIETTARIREWEEAEQKNKRPGFAGIPIVALTANALFGMKDLFLQSGFNDYLSKPIEIMKLNEIMEKWIPAEKQIKSTSKIRRESSCGDGGLVIKGVEINRGISLTGGTEAGYRKVLAQFAADAAERLDWLKGFSAEYKHNQEDKRQNFELDLAGFTTRVHALKGAAGTIGAAEAEKDAAALEAAGKAGDTAAIGELLPVFLIRLLKLISAIEEALMKSGGNELEAKKGRDNSFVKDRLRLLLAALEEKNMKEIDRLIEEIESAADEQTGKGINSVSDKVLMGEYKVAISETEQLAGDIL